MAFFPCHFHFPRAVFWPFLFPFPEMEILKPGLYHASHARDAHGCKPQPCASMLPIRIRKILANDASALAQCKETSKQHMGKENVLSRRKSLNLRRHGINATVQIFKIRR